MQIRYMSKCELFIDSFCKRQQLLQDVSRLLILLVREVDLSLQNFVHTDATHIERLGVGFLCRLQQPYCPAIFAQIERISKTNLMMSPVEPGKSLVIELFPHQLFRCVKQRLPIVPLQGIHTACSYHHSPSNRGGQPLD